MHILTVFCAMKHNMTNILLGSADRRPIYYTARWGPGCTRMSRISRESETANGSVDAELQRLESCARSMGVITRTEERAPVSLGGCSFPGPRLQMNLTSDELCAMTLTRQHLTAVIHFCFFLKRIFHLFLRLTCILVLHNAQVIRQFHSISFLGAVSSI